MEDLAPMTELRAVNLVLRNMGEAPVNTLTGSALPPEASVAKQTLDEVSRSLQTRGWYFNREYHQLTPDNDNKIALPSNTLGVRTVEEDRGTPVTKRGQHLYNMTPFESGYTFEKAMKLEIIAGLPFDDLPESARKYIAYSAARMEQIREEGDQLNYQEDHNDEQKAWAELVAEQLAAEPLTLESSTITDVLNLQYQGGY